MKEDVRAHLSQAGRFYISGRGGPKILHTRKKLAIFSGVDSKSFYHLIFRIEQKSRFLRKHVEEILELCKALELHVKHNHKHKHLLLCLVMLQSITASSRKWLEGLR